MSGSYTGVSDKVLPSQSNTYFAVLNRIASNFLCVKCACRYPVFFLTCAGSKHYADPRMNSLEAALIFAKSSKLQVGTQLS